MESSGEWEKMKNVINELTQGRDFAQQLQVQLNSPSSSRETRELLAKKILESYEKSLNIMNSGEAEQEPPHCHGGGSPKSEDSDQELQIKSSKKTMPRWKQIVRVTPGAGIEGTLDDGFSWRKYGQKDILGAKFPRGYYRCTHRHSQGCQATKQVQRSDSDPSVFDVTYRGTHTCWQAANAGPLTQTNTLVQNQEPNSTQELENLRRNLHIETEGLDTVHRDQQQQQQRQQQQQQQQLHFPSPSGARPENNNAYPPHMVNDIGSFGTNSEYNFSMFHEMNAGFQNFSESQGTHDVVSTSASASNSPTVGLDFPFGNATFDPNFSFGNSGGFFP